MTKELYIIRHGQTEFNRKRMVQGSGIDAPLNETGYAQARAFHAAYGHLPFCHVYVSELQRTHQSVAPFLESGLSHTVLSGLNEISWGHKEGRILTKADDEHHHWMMNGWRSGQLHLKVQGGESPLEVQARQRKALEHILQKNDERRVLICMHGRALKIFMCTLMEHCLSEMNRYDHSNLCLYHLKYESGKFELLRENANEHLEAVKPLVGG